MTAAAQWINYTFADFDMAVTLLIHKLYEIAGWFFSPIFVAQHYIGSPAGCVVVLLFLLFFVRKSRKFIFAMIFGVLIGALITNLGIKIFVERPRPYFDESSVYYQLWIIMGSHVESEFSFPSGHATAAFAMMTPIFILGDKRKSWLSIIYALLMLVSRVYLVVHFPSDVIAGMLVGIFAGIMGTLISKKLPHSCYTFEFFKKRKKTS